MATRGKFGRYPTTSTQPNLANTIVSLAREMQAQRDSNIMDAWNKGGTFEGKPVTDQMVLSHWQERMKHVAKDDPLYDTYSETVDQLHYSIAESKISTLYAQGKVGAKAMARFYTNWAKKIPVNSEFHRVLERNAAQFMKSLKKGGGGRGGGGRGLTANQLGQQKYEAPGMYLTDALTSVARDQLVIHGDETLDKVRLGVEENDPGAMVHIIDALNANEPYRKEVMGTLHMMNPNIPANGKLTIGLYTSVLNTQANHLNKRAWQEFKDGHIPTFNSLQNQRDKVRGLQRQAGAWQSTDHYYEARQDFLQIWDSPTQTPDAKIAAARQYQGVLSGLRTDAEKRGDPRQVKSLQGEIDSYGVPVQNPDGTITYVPDSSHAVPSLWEDFSTNSASPSYQSEKGDNHTSAESMRAFQEVSDAVKGQRMVYTYGKFSGGKFTAGSGGDSIGAIDIRYLSQDPNAYKAMPVAGAFGFEDVFVQGAPVMAVRQRPQVPNEFGYPTDVPLAPGEVAPEPERVGTAYDVREGGVLVRVYGVPQGDGSEMYTAIPPFAVGVNENFNQVSRNGEDVVVISMPATMKSPYGFSDPDSVKRTGVTPAGMVMTPYLAKALATPEGVQQLSKFSNSAGEVMNYAAGMYGVGTPKTLAAYGEILNTGRDVRIKMGTEEPEHFQRPFSEEIFRANSDSEEQTRLQNPSTANFTKPSLPVLSWTKDQDQGINPLAPIGSRNRQGPTIILPQLDPLTGGLGGRVINPNEYNNLPSGYKPPPPPVTPLQALRERNATKVVLPKPPPPPPPPSGGTPSVGNWVAPAPPAIKPYDPKQHYGGY